jgi:hypothetical protein
MMSDDRTGDLQDTSADALWLMHRLADDELAPATRWDVADAMKVAEEFRKLVRVIRSIDQSHVRNAYGVRAART